MTEASGVQRAIDAAGGGPEGHKKIAELLGTSVQFIYGAKRRGFFPVDRARIVADVYAIPLVDLVRSDLRALIANS
jgi:hypothetical protein